MQNPSEQEVTAEPADAPAIAKSARLRYVTDSKPGIRRLHENSESRYIAPDGSPVTDEATLQRIRHLAIPPAYTDVWICPHANGHLQATGRDAKGRKQYRYHERWREVRDATKYDRMRAFGNALPALRARVEANLSRRGLPREKVLAAIVRLMETTRIRIGNEEYARTNASYGLTTLKNDHVAVDGTTLHFDFRGKSGKQHRIDLRDKRLARIVAKCQELPGQELFEFVDPTDGSEHDITSDDVNTYLQETMGETFTAKDFRTWAGTVLCAQTLMQTELPETQTARKKQLTAVIKEVAERLGNTPAVCRKCYIHPGILDAYLSGTLSASQSLPESITPGPPGFTDLTPEEKNVLAFLDAVQ